VAEEAVEEEVMGNESSTESGSSKDLLNESGGSLHQRRYAPKKKRILIEQNRRTDSMDRWVQLAINMGVEEGILVEIASAFGSVRKVCLFDQGPWFSSSLVV
jgi:hypothetical protein